MHYLLAKLYFCCVIYGSLIFFKCDGVREPWIFLQGKQSIKVFLKNTETHSVRQRIIFQTKTT